MREPKNQEKLMESYWMWWLAALVLVITEMFSGTFYLLAVACGLSAAGLAAYLGAAWSAQAMTAAVLCSASVAGIYFWKQQHVSSAQGNFAYDIGQTVHIASWSDARHARVNYRGAEWEAQLSDVAASDATKTAWRIQSIKGSLLIIE
jgi:membrane protein implicated in regulation of membrane protease activity